jgi:hypothetical protein
MSVALSEKADVAETMALCRELLDVVAALLTGRCACEVDPVEAARVRELRDVVREASALLDYGRGGGGE